MVVNFFWRFFGVILGLGVSATAMATAVGNDSMGRFHYTVIARVSVFIVGGAIDPLSDFFSLFWYHCWIRLSFFFLGTGEYCRYVLGWIRTTGVFDLDLFWES